MQQGNVAAWIDVDDVYDPESAARTGVDGTRLLWVRCGHTPNKFSETSAGTCSQIQSPSVSSSERSAPAGGGGSPHPRSEGRGMPQAISDLLSTQLRSSALPPRRRDKSIGTPGVANRALPGRAFDREEQIATDRLPPRRGEQVSRVIAAPQDMERNRVSPKEPKGLVLTARAPSPVALHKDTAQEKKRSWTRLDQALWAADLLLQSGGFSLIVLDLGSTPAEKSWRIPLTTWFRFRAACERTRGSLLLLTRHPCAKSSAELVVRMATGRMEAQGNALTGIAFRSQVERQRFERPADNVIPIRKPPQSERPGAWKGRAAWAI